MYALRRALACETVSFSSLTARTLAKCSSVARTCRFSRGTHANTGTQRTIAHHQADAVSDIVPVCAVKNLSISQALRVSGESVVKLVLSDESVLRFHTIWLRDHCLCRNCRDPITRQRLIDSTRIPPDLSIFSIGLEADGKVLRIEWSDHDVNFTGWAAPLSPSSRISSKGHISCFPIEWLLRHTYWGSCGAVASASEIDPATDSRSRVLWRRAHFGDPADPITDRSFPTVRHDQ